MSDWKAHLQVCGICSTGSLCITGREIQKKMRDGPAKMKPLTEAEIVARLRDMDRQIIHGSAGDTIFRQAADAIERLAKTISDMEAEAKDEAKDRTLERDWSQ